MLTEIRVHIGVQSAIRIRVVKFVAGGTIWIFTIYLSDKLPTQYASPMMAYDEYNPFNEKIVLVPFVFEW